MLDSPGSRTGSETQVGLETPTCVSGYTTDFLICGMARSGTTLVAERLACHPDVWVSRETHFFSMIGRYTADVLEHGDFADFEAGLRSMVTQYGCDISEDELPLEALRAGWPFRNTTEAFFALVRGLSDGSPVVGEKTPRHMEHVDQVLRESPTAKAVLCLRDPRAVYTSLAKVPWGSPEFDDFGDVWAAYAEEAHRLAQEYPARVRCLRYEDIVADVDAALAPTWEMLGLSAPTTVPAGAKTFSPENEPWKVGAAGPIQTRSLHAWKAELGTMLGDALLERIGASAGQFGYF